MAKVALCMRGAVSKKIGDFTDPGSLYQNTSGYVDWVSCFNSIKRHIIEPNEGRYQIDIFAHCWNTDLEDDIVKRYKPRSHLFENNDDYKDDILSKCDGNSKNFGGVSQALTIKKVIELKEAYERENGMQYDIVILYRYDVILWKNMDLNVYTGLNSASGPVYINAHPDCNGDFHFVMSNDTAHKFKHLYDSMGSASGNPHILHWCIRNYIVNFMKSIPVMDNVVPGRHQEVIRKIDEFSITPGHISRSELDTYRDDTY